MGKQKTCASPGYNRKIKPFMTYCYQHYHQKVKKDYNPKKLQKVHGGSK